MLVRSYDCRIQQQVFQVGIDVQHLEYPLPDVPLAPSIVPLINRVPFPESSGKITPGRSGFSQPKDGVYESAIVFATSTRIAFFPGQQRCNLMPLFIRELVSSSHTDPPFAIRDDNVISFCSKPSNVNVNTT